VESVVVDKIVAKVDHFIILKSEAEINYLQFLSSGQDVSGDVRCRVFESLIINKLLLAKAEIDSITVEPDMVESNLNQRMQVFISQFGSEEKLEAYYGKSVEEFKGEFRDQVKEQLVIQRMDGEITQGIDVNPKEVRKFFAKIPEDSLPFFSTEVEVGQITHKIKQGVGSKKEVIQQLRGIRDKIASGFDFGEMARLYSQDPGNKDKGGELGFWKKTDLDPDFVAGALALKPGEISDVIESQFGFHLIQLIEVRGNEFNSRHILLRPSFSNKDVIHAQNYLDSIRKLVVVDSVPFEKAAKDFSEDMVTSSSGGIFTDQATGSTRIPMENLDTDLFFILDTMEVGAVTGPIAYRTYEGDDALRIVYYKSKVKPHRANLKDDYQKIYLAAMDEKRFRAKEEWFFKSKDEVFIRIDEEYSDCKILEK
jgi:peptidyl-prolyl cis-trans isomerase SurA